MKVFVDKNICIGCGSCQGIAPEIFEIEDDGLAKAKDTEISDNIKEEVQDAIESCPVSAITEKENQ